MATNRPSFDTVAPTQEALRGYAPRELTIMRGASFAKIELRFPAGAIPRSVRFRVRDKSTGMQIFEDFLPEGATSDYWVIDADNGLATLFIRPNQFNNLKPGRRYEWDFVVEFTAVQNDHETVVSIIPERGDIVLLAEAGYRE